MNTVISPNNDISKIAEILLAIDSARSRLRIALEINDYKKEHELTVQLSNLQRMVEDFVRESEGQEAMEYANLCM